MQLFGCFIFRINYPVWYQFPPLNNFEIFNFEIFSLGKDSQTRKLYNMFISPFVWKTPVCTSVEWLKNEIGGWVKVIYVVHFITCYLQSFIHSVFCLRTGPKPPPKRFLHIVRSRASSFK